MTVPFIVFGLPRSRTYWLSRFLSYGPWQCGHDVLGDFGSVEDLLTYFTTPYRGASETALVDYHHLIDMWSLYPKKVVVLRPIEEVRNALAKIGIDFGKALEKRQKLLQEVSEMEETLTVNFHDLSQEATCAKIFEHCLEIPHDRTWWQGLKDKNLQVDMIDNITKFAFNYTRFQNFKNEVRLRG